jgi:PAS domain S-box-containing protein
LNQFRSYCRFGHCKFNFRKDAWFFAARQANQKNGFFCLPALPRGNREYIQADKVKSSLRILNLEDNATDAELNQAMISARWPQCELVRVASREEFIKALEKDNFDLILSDYSIPGFDGQSALQIAREKSPGIPFIFVSGTIGEDAAIEALKNGATDYVLKHRLMRLIPAVDRALRESEEHAECERAEQCMRESEHKYRALFESLADAAFLADEQSGKIIDANHSAEILLGCSRGEILGQEQTKFLALDKIRERAGAAEDGAQSLTHFECDMIRASGPPVPVSVHGTRLKLYGRSLVLWLCHQLEISSANPPEKNLMPLSP